LHPQIFAGVSYLLGAVIMFELRRTSRKMWAAEAKTDEAAETADPVETVEKSPV
jgi:hypothetical protein